MAPMQRALGISIDPKWRMESPHSRSWAKMSGPLAMDRRCWMRAARPVGVHIPLNSMPPILFSETSLSICSERSRSDTSWPSPPVQELVLHQVDIYTVSAAGVESDPASATITPESANAAVPSSSSTKIAVSSLSLRKDRVRFYSSSALTRPNAWL